MSEILSKVDQDRIADAVRAAEAGTSGEIRCVIAPRIAPGRPAPVLVCAASAALLLPAFALLAGLPPEGLARIFGVWSIGHASAQDGAILSALLVYLLIQAAVFALAAILVSTPPLRALLHTDESAAKRVRGAAMDYFMFNDLRATEGRTGVLIFAALAEHRVEVIVDEAIHGLVPENTWRAIANELTAGIKAGRLADGFIAAVAGAGAALAEHAPGASADRNELPDHPAVLG